MEINDILDECKYLPKEFRDFHDQKDLFKLIHSKIALHEGINHISWIDAHIYVIDVFLWFMAKRGYTLQKARHKIDFVDIFQEIQEMNEEKFRLFGELISSQSAGNTSKEGEESPLPK